VVKGSETVTVAGREVAVSNPGKVLFPEAGHTKLDLVRYYLAVAEGALQGAGGRPNVLVRHPNGVGADFFFQKRAPESRPDWIEVVSLKFPSGRSAEEVVPRDAAALAWMANLACLELHPHPVRAEDLDHPDELRVDLDPVPGVTWSDVRAVAEEVRAFLGELGLVGMAEDIRFTRDAHLRAHRAALGVRRRRRAALALFARDRTADAGPRHQQVVEGGAAGRLSRLQPERQGPDDRRRLFRASHAGRARLRAARLG
jgi:hypothetical protein